MRLVNLLAAVEIFVSNATNLHTSVLPYTQKSERELCYSKLGPLTIYVESQATLTAIKSSAIKSRAVLDCQKVLFKIREFIKLCWVSGHSNIMGNEMAEELARGGSRLIYRL